MSTASIQQQIFIGGCSRSGTTLLGAMIGTHKDVVCTPESHFKMDVLRSPMQLESGVDTQQAVNYIQQHWRFKLWELALDDTAVPYDAIGSDYGQLLNHIAGTYAATHNKPDATVWVDHTPENISYTETLLTLFPNAKFIHIVRDGRGVAASIMSLDWGPNSIIKTARWWMRMVSFGLAVETAVSPSKIIRVRYEDLVCNPETTLQQLCDFLELDYQPEMVNATGFIPPSYTTRQHTFVGEKPNPAIAYRWQQKLSPREIEIFENQTRNFLQLLNYEPQYGINAKSPTFTEIQKGKIKELVRGEIINKIKWLKRSYPLWLSKDFYTRANFSDTNN